MHERSTLCLGTLLRFLTILGKIFLRCRSSHVDACRPRLTRADNRSCLFCRHYIENTSQTEDLVWIEIYKSDRVADISLTQWLALTPPAMAAQTLKVDVSVIRALKKEKQLLIL